MRKLLLTSAAFGLAATMGAAPVIADDHAEAKPEMRDQTWYRVNLIKFHPGNGERIGEIIDMFDAADKAAGVDSPIIMHMNTGAWDMAVFFKMQHGIQQMGWRSTPEGDKWDAAFNEMVGGEDEARKIFAEFQSFVAAEENHIGHIHPDEDEEG
ncbi:hypothetical protein [Altererythrobacter ishigakiensis]|nr:hypothetical protein [Altererythrobacter ishigakiensis]